MACPSSTSRPTHRALQTPLPPFGYLAADRLITLASSVLPEVGSSGDPSSSQLLQASYPAIQLYLSIYFFPSQSNPITTPTTSPLPDHTSLAAALRGCPPTATPPAQPLWSKPAPSSGPAQRGCAFRFSSAAYVLPNPIQTPVLRRHRGHNRLAPSYPRLVAGPCRRSDLLYPSLSRFELRYRGERCHGIMLTPLRALPLC